MTQTSDADQEKLRALREVLPATGAGIYLDTATRGPLPAETAAAMRDADDWELRVGRATEGRDEDAQQRYAEARAVLAALVVADPAEMALTSGLDEALRVGAWLPDWRPGDGAVAVSPTPEALAALEGVRRSFGIELQVVEPAGLGAPPSPTTRLVVLPHVDGGDGRLLDVAGVAAHARAVGAFTVLDATLSAGAVPIDTSALGVDVIAFAADRWLLGPEGTAAVWLGAAARDAGRSPLAGAAAHETVLPGVANPWPDARRFEPGALPRTSALGLARSVGWLEMYVGLEWAHERGQRLTRRLHERLSAATNVEVLTPAASMATMVCFRVERWPVEEALAELRRRVFAIIGATPDREALRASVGWFNTDEELDRFADAVGLLAEHTPDTLPRRPPLIVR